MMALSAKMIRALALPVSVSLFSFLAAAATEGATATWWAGITIMLVVTGVLIGRTTWLAHQHQMLAHRNRLLENRDKTLSKRIRALEKQHIALQRDVQARLVVREWRRAFPGEHIRLAPVPEEN
jgi:hypothetical protein